MVALSISGFLAFLQTAFFAVGYIQGSNLFPEPLNSDDEKMYLEKLKNGDEEARNVLIELRVQYC